MQTDYGRVNCWWQTLCRGERRIALAVAAVRMSEHAKKQNVPRPAELSPVPNNVWIQALLMVMFDYEETGEMMDIDAPWVDYP